VKFGNDQIFDMKSFDEMSRWIEWSENEFSHRLALQRTAPSVTAPASTAAFPPTMQVPRRTPRSLSLGSLCRFALLTEFWLLFEMKG
jgi:hypothetical protein